MFLSKLPPEGQPGSGQCHGPGCDRNAVSDYFCSERCQSRWQQKLGEPLEDADPYTPQVLQSIMAVSPEDFGRQFRLMLDLFPNMDAAEVAIRAMRNLARRLEQEEITSTNLRTGIERRYGISGTDPDRGRNTEGPTPQCGNDE